MSAGCARRDAEEGMTQALAQVDAIVATGA
jgi:hypothetical protein